jgi:hypothetical protein
LTALYNPFPVLSIGKTDFSKNAKKTIDKSKNGVYNDRIEGKGVFEPRGSKARFSIQKEYQTNEGKGVFRVFRARKAPFLSKRKKEC